VSHHETFPALIKEHYEGLLAGDEVAYQALVHDDFIQDWPQTGERVRGKSACLNIARNYPGGTPQITLGRISGEGDHWVAEGTSRYPDGTDYHMVAVLELRDGKIVQETDYFGPPYPAPEWRSQWVEPLVA
jgi:ketosteroid isomerase-like protein